jgi:hypothetical protein
MIHIHNEMSYIKHSYILFLVEYGCGTWFLTLRDKYTLRVFESDMLKSVCGTKGVDLTAEKRKLYTNEFYDLSSSPNTIRVTISRKMRWAVYVGRMGKKKCTYRVWWKNLKERDHLEDLDVDGRIILKCILKELFECVDWIDLTQNRGKRRACVKKDTKNSLSIKMCGIP